MLWVGVRARQEAAPHVRIFIYAREGVTPELLRAQALERFNIELLRPVEVRPPLCRTGRRGGEGRGAHRGREGEV